MFTPNPYPRWLVVVGAVLIQIALGTLFCWGAMTIFLSPYLGLPEEQTIYIFGVGLLSFAFTMGFAGEIQQKIGPKKSALLGCSLLGLGIFTSIFQTTLWGFIFTYGFLFGSGIAFGYVGPIVLINQWFPDKKGLVTGIVMAGFGASGFLFNFVIKAMANPLNLTVLNPQFLPMLNDTIPRMFLMLGILYVTMIIVGTLLLRYPPKDFTPPLNTKNLKPISSKTSSLNLSRTEIIRTSTFWQLWLMFFLSTMAGLMVIGSYARFAQLRDSSGQFLYLIGTADFIQIGAIAALFNGLGRIFWGKIADLWQYKRAMQCVFILQGIFLILYYFTNNSIALYLIVTCGIYFCFGGNFTLFPSATSELFGPKHLGANYGFVFTGYGIAGFIGATMVQSFYAFFGSYLVLFLVMGILSISAAGIIQYLKNPQKKSEQ